MYTLYIHFYVDTKYNYTFNLVHYVQEFDFSFAFYFLFLIRLFDDKKVTLTSSAKVEFIVMVYNSQAN